MTLVNFRVSPVALLASLLLILAFPRCHIPETRVGKEMCNGIFADRVELHADGSATVHATNGAVVRIDHPECAELQQPPHAGIGPEIEE
jgi:hypothetical protein